MISLTFLPGPLLTNLMPTKLCKCQCHESRDDALKGDGRDDAW